MDILLYKNARIEVGPAGSGWKAYVKFGDGYVWHEIPSTLDPLGKQTVINKAKAIIDLHPNR